MNRGPTQGMHDQRLHRRHDCRGSIEWAFFNHIKRFRGVILNFSEAGAYIESRQKLKPGANILLHTGRVIIACEKTDDCLPPHTTLLAEIKWDTALDGRKDVRRYGAGLRYHF